MKNANHSKPDSQKSFSLEISDDDGDVAYLKLPTHSGAGSRRMSRSVRLVDLMGAYKGPDLVFDFDEEGVLVGIEILA